MTRKTPLYDAHVALGAKMVPFAGYDMPIQYKEGIIAEHEWVRSHAGIFDVSHMGQAILKGAGAAELCGKLTPSDFTTLALGKAKYTVLTNEQGGIIDDLIITRLTEDSLFLVLNAARKEVDVKWFTEHLKMVHVLEEFTDRALIALQGPEAEKVLAALIKQNPAEFDYMTAHNCELKDGTVVLISRLGYTGEDGFEISIPGQFAEAFWNSMLKNPSVKPIGLGARDSLRLEMGYPLYGHDLDETTSPVEASLGWVVSKEHSGFTGDARILKEKAGKPSRKRMGVKLTDKGIAREGAVLKSKDGVKIGTLTSGGFSPSLKTAIGQGYVDIAHAEKGREILVEVRGRDIPAVLHTPDFMAPRTKTANALKKAV